MGNAQRNDDEAHLELVVIEPIGPAWPVLPRLNSALSKKFGFQISRWLSLLNDSSSAPATPPVASKGTF